MLVHQLYNKQIFSLWWSNLSYILKYNIIFIKFGIIYMYLMIVAIFFQNGEVIVRDFLGFNVSRTVVSKNNNDIQ